MKKFLSYLLLSFIISPLLHAQDFRLTRPVADNIQTNGSYLFAEPGASISSVNAHQGIDMDVVFDTVYAAHSGQIGLVSDAGSCGLHLIIDDYWNDEKLNTLYCHMDEVFVSKDDSIQAGQPIGISGESGNTTGPHLHFEVRLGRHSYDPGLARSRKNPELWVAIEGTGAIYGTVPNATYGTRVDISPYPKPRPPYDTYGWSLTYSFDETTIGSDPDFRENYAIGDVVPGTYSITAQNGAYRREVVVEAGNIVDADANATTLENEAEIASQLELHQNYPNPFNPNTVISYSLPASNFVNLAVFDVMGKKVSELTNRYMPAGKHDVHFDASALPSGMYFYRLNTNNQTLTRKLTLIK